MFIPTNVYTMPKGDTHKCESTQLATDLLQEPSDEFNPSCSKDIPPDRNKNITRKPGFIYAMVTIDYKKGPRFGLGIKHYKDQVVVSKSEKGSLCGDRLKRLDHIIDVNGTQVADRDVCKEMLIKSLQKTNKVTLVIERPLQKDAIESMEAFLADAARQSAASSPVRDVNNPKAKQTQNQSLVKKTQSNSVRRASSDSIRKAAASKESVNPDNLREVYKIPSDENMRSRERADQKQTVILKPKKTSKLLGMISLLRKQENRE